VQNFATLSIALDFEPLPFKNVVRYLKSNFTLLWFNDCSICMPNLEKFGLCTFELAHLGIWDPLIVTKNIY